jgi:hypothetical protein
MGYTDTGSDPSEEPALDKAIRFQNDLITHATDGGFNSGDPEYQEIQLSY